MTHLHALLERFRTLSFSERDKGTRFERLMQSYLQTDPMYAPLFSHVWLWEEFPSRADFGGKDTGIDLVAETHDGGYWAIQCKCYRRGARIDKPAVDTFLSTSNKTFLNEAGETACFTHRLWIDTTEGGFNSEALKTIQNQQPPVSRIGLLQLEQAPVDWQKMEVGLAGGEAQTRKKQPRDHQKQAIETAHTYFLTRDRGKLIMACGTGKTYTSLCIAERETSGRGLVLFLVPSIALLGQTLREWTADASEAIQAVCICSDAEVTKVKRKKEEDADGFTVEDLALPASTFVPSIVSQLRRLHGRGEGMTVVFSTYQSIGVVAEAQRQIGAEAEFDLIVCDEAHRTTGVTLKDAEESAFVRVHDSRFLCAKKRLYMTATPRLYSDTAQSKARESEATLCSMDDAALFGDEIYRIGFGEAVEKQLLADYKVLVLTLGEDQVTPALQAALANHELEIKTDDAAKLIGCINALSKKTLLDSKLLKETDPAPMRRAVAFCQSIKISKQTVTELNGCRESYYDTLSEEERSEIVSVEADHVDGTMNASIRDRKLSWLKSTPADGRECRILCNVRCLSEGVDVPSLDAVLFLSARNSQVDVVQSVGRVMRTSPGKKYGYIIIPVVIPADVKPEEALGDNERFRVVWTVLNALRAHDDRFNATVNKIELNRRKPDNILVGGTAFGSGENGAETIDATSGETSYGGNAAAAVAQQLQLKFEQLSTVIYARMVQKVGNKRYWEQWAQDIAKIYEQHKRQIAALVDVGGIHAEAFGAFLAGLRKNLNPQVDKAQAVDMLAQHIITRPVFEALFENYSFVKNNPISQSMQRMLDLLNEEMDPSDNEKLERFYKSVRQRAEGVDNAEGKQKIIIELYDKFFRTALPKTVEQLGIVYTPVEVVDFIVRSVSEVLVKEFGRSISDENVNVIDPFTGTGTFIVRLLQSGLIKPQDLERKYLCEIHANEIVLLAYYIASINIENAFHDLSKAGNYTSFPGICLTDTFQIGEEELTKTLPDETFRKNYDQLNNQKNTPIQVVIGNPPYSVGQKSANDNAQNLKYAKLEKRIEEKYVASSTATNNKAVYDSYIKAFRYATDKLDRDFGGVIGFVTNGAWIDSNGLDGFRKCIEEEFSAIYVFNLRGNQRTSGELSRKEGGKIFGSGSRTPVAITILVKHPGQKEKATIHYYDIGDYLSREEKLKIIRDFGNIGRLPSRILTPNEHGDWINQRNDAFGTWIPIEPEKKFDKNTQSWFNAYAIGVATNRDIWVYGFSKQKVADNMKRMIGFYNQQRTDLLNEVISELEDATSKISWTRALKRDALRNIQHSFDIERLQVGVYRPFCKSNLYYDKPFIESPGLWSQFFPTPTHQNLVICVSGVGASKDFSVLITNCIPDLQLMFNGQCFPLYYNEENTAAQLSLFDSNDRSDRYIRHDAVSNFILKQARNLYGGRVTKEDIFYYVYGFLHSPEYRKAFSADLKKMLPRIPLVEKPADFWSFCKAGRDLADLHLNYETIEPARQVVVNYCAYEEISYRVEKMRFVSKGDKTAIQYNRGIVIENIPLEAYDYVVNGKSAIEWLMERYQLKTDTASGITNDPNDWGAEHNNEKYIFNLLLRIINLSVQTVEIVKALPKLNF